ncbi:MAG TPA: hypothetical protein VI756_08345 [Blastocatellia bacterium]
MKRIGWSLAGAIAGLLDSHESEAVLGDLIEAQQGAWHSAAALFGLVVRRQAALWWDWRPWVAGAGLALPASFLLMGVSLSVAVSVERLVPGNASGHQTPGTQALLPLVAQLAMLVIWSWTGGFAVGLLSRRTIWATALFYLSPCVFCLSRFRIPGMSRFDLLLFLVPVISGIYYGVRSSRIGLRHATTLAFSITVLMIVWWAGRGLYPLDWMLVLPAWYIAASSWRPLRTAS